MVRTLLLLLAVAHLAIQLGVWLPNVWRRRDIQRDMTVYYQAAQKVRKHQPLYHPLIGNAPDVNRGAYIYPPQFAIVVSPVARLPYLTYARLCYVVTVLAFWGYALALVMLAGARRTVANVLLWGALLGITPGVTDAMDLGQVDPLLWALFGFALCTRYRGVLLGISAQIKPFTLVVLALAVWRADRRVLVPAALTILAGFAIGCAVYGPLSYVHWAVWGLPIPSQGSFDADNLSLTYAGLRLLRMLGWWRYVGGDLPVWARLYLAAAGAAGVAAAAYLARRQAPPIHYSLTLLAGLFCSPICWITYLPLALVPFALWIKEIKEDAGTKAAAVVSNLVISDI